VNIWMYWENVVGGRGMPPFVQLCIDTVQRNRGHATVHLLDNQTIHNFLPDLRPEWHQLKTPAHKADYIRTRLGLKYGGMWLDCDMAVLGSLDPLFEIPTPLDFACQDIGSAIGCFVAKPGCELLRHIAAAQDAVLDANLHDFPWNGIGNDLLKALGAGYSYHRWREWTVDEIVDGKVSKLLSEDESFAANVDRNAVVFHFCGNLLSPLLNRYANHRQQSLLRQQMLMSKILRRGLGVAEPRLGARLSDFAGLLDLGDAVGRRFRRLST
jgi:hypothetical protein